MTEPSTAMIDVEQIEVEDGFNPRSRFHDDALAELVASVREQGILSALTVRSDGNGGYILIAGARRLEAARQAGLQRVPAVIRSADGALAAAIAENLIRADLDPIEEARALERLAQSEKLATHKQIAARVGKSPAHVSERLRLLALPEGCHGQIAAGAVPVAAERELRKVAKVSPAVAEGVCGLVERGLLEGRDLSERFGEVLCALAEARFEGAPTMIDTRGAALSALVSDPELRASLAERYAAARPYEQSEDPAIRFEEVEVDAARAAGCLVEHKVDRGAWESTVAFVTDAEFAADLAARAIERIEKQAAELAESRARWAGNGRDGEDASASPEDRKEAQRAARAKAKADAAAARASNLELGRKLVARRGAKARREHSLARAKAVAAVVLSDNERLAAGGLRLALPQLQEVEVKQLKSGEQRERVTYKEVEDCRAYLANRIAEARSANEVLELLADALIAATLVNQRELPQSKREVSSPRAAAQVEELLATEIKALRPRRSRARG
jgi:ParB/RepB/Spo0J family partition protein